MSPAQPLFSCLILVLCIVFPCKTCRFVPAGPAGGFTRPWGIAATVSFAARVCTCPVRGRLCSCPHHLLTLPLPATFSLLFPFPKVASCPAKPIFPPVFPSPVLFMMDSKGWG